MSIVYLVLVESPKSIEFRSPKKSQKRSISELHICELSILITLFVTTSSEKDNLETPAETLFCCSRKARARWLAMDANSLLEMMDKWLAHSRPSFTQILSRASRSQTRTPLVTLRQTKTKTLTKHNLKKNNVKKNNVQNKIGSKKSHQASKRPEYPSDFYFLPLLSTRLLIPTLYTVLRWVHRNDEATVQHEER